MSQKSDDSIEQFFRKAVVQQDKTFMERDWHSMEKMLDEQAVVDAGKRVAKMRTAIKVIAILLVISSLIMVGSETRTDSGNVQMQAAAGKVGPRREVKTENPAADLHSSLVKHPQTIDEGTGSRIIQADRKITSSKKIHNNQINSHPALATINMDQINRSEDARSDVSSVAGADELKNSAIKNEEIILPPENSVGARNENLHSGAEKSSPGKEDEELKADSIKEIVNATYTQEDEEEERGVRAPRVIVTGFVSPDFSTTSLAKYSRPSGVFGILVGYKILNRVTLMTGITKGLKKYEGYGSEYTPPEGYWQNRTNGIVPDEVEGKCGIIEIPLLVQVDLMQRAKSRVFVSAGVSSYFMRSENYQYTFHEPNPGAANSWTAREPSNYLFKIGHLSAGYDRAIGKNISIGIEPFLKVPFQGIGWTDINLYSTGAYLNLRYTILRTQQ